MRKAWYQNLDWTILLIWVLLVSIGLSSIYSATHGPASEYLLDSVQQNFWRQLAWMGLSVIGIAVILLIPSRFFQNISFFVYGLTILLLIAALVAGREINGARSWIYIGPIGFQSSELAKLGTIMAIAQLFGQARDNPNLLRLALIAVGFVLLPVVLIVLQNDAGTALIFLALVPVVLFWSGIPLNVVVLLVSPALAGYLAIVYWPAAVAFSVLFAIGMFWSTRKRMMGGLALLFTGGTTGIVFFALNKILQQHQVARIASFVDPEAYRLTSGFHIIQSRAAIGSGGLTGKGFMQGTQTQMAFVPEQSTDFIFAVVGEEFGFVGTFIVLILFALLLIRLLIIGHQTRHPFASMFVAGAVGLFFTHVLINVGMTIGVMPVIGIPLPFLSYGGSALLANSVLLGIALNFHMRRANFPKFSRA